MRLFINVYEKDENKVIQIKKQCEAQAIDLEFGTVRKLMELINVEQIEDTTALIKTIYSAWDEITEVLGDIFPDMEPGDWEHVKLKELIPTVVDVLKYSMMEIMGIPSDGKN